MNALYALYLLPYQANHAVSDQLSFNRLLAEMLQVVAASRAATPLPAPSPLPLPPSVEGALLGKEQRQNEEIKVHGTRYTVHTVYG